MSPDGESVVTGAGDETLRFWHVFCKARSSKVRTYVCRYARVSFLGYIRTYIFNPVCVFVKGTVC